MLRVAAETTPESTLEIHASPGHWLSDGAQSRTFDLFATLMQNVAKIASAAGKSREREALVV